MSAATDSGFVYTVGAAVSIALVTAAGTQLFARLRDAAERRRNRYAGVVQTLVAWVEFPYRIRRRVDDEPVTLAALAALGHQLQEQLAGDQAWVVAENRHVGRTYLEVRSAIGAEVGPAASEAWALPAASKPTDMVLGNWGPGKLAAEQVARLEECIAHRFGWRRLRAALLSGSKGQRVAPAKA